MGAPNSGKRSRMDGETILLWVFITAVVLGVGSVAGAVHLGSLLSNDSQTLPANPFELVFGLLSPLFTRLMLSTPPAFIATLAGLAMLRVLQASFVIAFKASFSLGAMVAFIVTVAGLPIASIGAPFWGLVFGFAISALLERDDFKAPART